MPSTTLEVINRQIDEALPDLEKYRPTAMQWHQRAKHAAAIFVPWLESNALAIKAYVEGTLNAPSELRRMWMEIRPHVHLPREQIEAFDLQLSLDDVLRESVTGEVVSNVVTKFLLGHHSDLKSNGRSDYPDVYVSTLDYSGIPEFKRDKSGDEETYGAARKGKEQRPVRVPDGLEIKTCRNHIRVDCHNPHAGLHLALVFTEASRLFTVSDLRIAFLRSADYRESGRNTTATTVKFSFNGERFVTLLSRNST
ncbi:hypothetical protein [Schlesneria sp. T3-172]|uniref:hypothetical protein n=1 Tax=Schlesneria sphaerica TaxID=3373610 RepID=UPI0037CB878D